MITASKVYCSACSQLNEEESGCSESDVFTSSQPYTVLRHIADLVS